MESRDYGVHTLHVMDVRAHVDAYMRASKRSSTHAYIHVYNVYYTCMYVYLCIPVGPEAWVNYNGKCNNIIYTFINSKSM